MKLDPSSQEFRSAGHRLVDWIADYLDNIDSRRVLSNVQPGEIAQQFASAPSMNGKSYDELFAEFESKILPGITHWNHPSFFAYFSITRPMTLICRPGATALMPRIIASWVRSTSAAVSSSTSPTGTVMQVSPCTPSR